jgi:glycerol-3-phosphate acyltransferase PlsY
MNTLGWVLFAFFCGSVPFALVLGRLFTRTDIRRVGDGNPGGANALKAGGLRVGVPAILLEIAKGFLPVWLAQRYGIAGWSLVAVALAPALGHAFSPFLGFRGGKALGATGGAWVALIGLWTFPIFAVLALPAALIQIEDGWSANAGMLALLGYAILSDQAWMVTFAALNCALIVWTHRRELARRPRLRPWVAHLLARRQA